MGVGGRDRASQRRSYVGAWLRGARGFARRREIYRPANDPRTRWPAVLLRSRWLTSVSLKTEGPPRSIRDIIRGDSGIRLDDRINDSIALQL